MNRLAQSSNPLDGPSASAPGPQGSLKTMKKTLRPYEADGLVIEYDVIRCIHVEACVQGLPTVFDPTRHPWIAPGLTTADAYLALNSAGFTWLGLCLPNQIGVDLRIHPCRMALTGRP